MNENSVSYNHGITLNERKSIYITGVVKIDSFNEQEFLIDTDMGYLCVRGEGLEIIKLDTKDGIVSIKGVIDSINYSNANKKSIKKESFFEKIFK